MTTLTAALLLVCCAAGYWLFATLRPGQKPLPPALDGRVPQTRWFDVLGVSQFASAADIRRAYEEKSRACHPSLVNDASPEVRAYAARHYRQLTTAYQIGLRRNPK